LTQLTASANRAMSRAQAARSAGIQAVQSELDRLDHLQRRITPGQPTVQG
jgi:hypothetical protein